MKKNTKKRKIQIPAAQFGLPVSLSNMWELQSSIARGTAPNNPNNLMIKNNPANANIGNISEIAQAIPGAINTLTSPFQTSTATTGGEATMQSLTGIAEGAGSGAQLGMTIGGPVGGLVGGIAGAAVGLIGKKGKAAEMTSFTDFDEGTLGTGLRGAFRNKKLRRRRAAIRLNAFQNREAVAGTERLANEFNEDNTEFDTDVFEYGGKVPSSLAYVDDGELIQTPDGTVSKVPEQGQPTDSNLVNLPEGSRILSNTLKVPGTNKTFAELGDKVMTRKKSKGKDRYAQNADMLNEMNNKLMHDKLFAMQESIKAKKGIKNKTKELESFARGGDNTPAGYNADGFMMDPRFAGEISMGGIAPTPRVRDTQGIKGDVTAPWDNYGRESEAKVTTTNGVTVPWDNYGVTVPWDNYGVTAPWDNYGRVSETDAGNLPEVTINATRKASPKVTTTNRVTAPEIIPNLDTIDESFDIDATPEDIRTRTITGATVQPVITAPQQEPVRLEGLSSLVSGAASLAPIMSNLFTSSSEAVPANYNPYATAITNTMGRRRYNIDPLLRDIETNRNVANYAASQQRTNTGQDMAFRLQNAIATNKAIAAARAAESNANNQYKAEYANAMNNLGQQWVQATNLASELNARNRATARNIRRTGLGQLSQWAQNRELMSNQRSRDNAMLKLYDPFLQAGFTSADMSQFKKWLNKGGNR